MTTTGSLPILREDRASIDWTSAQYQAEITISGQSAIAKNALQDAPQLDALIVQGDAQWAVDMRCPRTLFASIARSNDSEVRCAWRQTDVAGELFLTPGLIATRPCYLDTSGLHDLWGSDQIEVAAGRWLVRGQVLRTQSLASSLLEFHKKPTLSDGEMEVTPDFGSGDLRFKVWLSPGYFDSVIQSNRDVQVAALIAAFGRIALLDQEDDEGYAILTHIKAALSEAGVPAWGDELNADFDPARAATAIEKFQILVTADDDL